MELGYIIMLYVSKNFFIIESRLVKKNKFPYNNIQ